MRRIARPVASTGSTENWTTSTPPDQLTLSTISSSWLLVNGMLLIAECGAGTIQMNARND
jgi:hypothetical protein